MKKFLIILFILLTIILVSPFAIWYGLNYYFIPKIVIPEIKNQIAIFNQENRLNLKIQEIDFVFLRGFQLKGIELSPLLTAKEIDLDIDYLALLSRKVHLPQINIFEPDLKIKRSKQGKWNYEAALKNLFGKKDKGQPSFIDIDQIILTNGQVHFFDQYSAHNQLNKNFRNVDIKIKNPHQEDYFIEISGTDAKLQDKIWSNFTYAPKTKAIQGKARLKIPDLADYINYYVDELILPWKTKKLGLDAQADFNFSQGNISIDGNYIVKNGQIYYGDIEFTGNASIRHKQKYFKNKKALNILSAQAQIDNLSLMLEKTLILEKGKCAATVTDTGISIQKLQGTSSEKPVDLKGDYIFQPSRALKLSGKLGESDNTFSLKLLSENSAEIAWLSTSEAVSFKIDSNIPDIKDLLFSGDLSGWINLDSLPGKILIDDADNHLTVSVEAGENDLKGRVDFSGKLQGELDKPETYSGKLGLKLKDFSVLGLEPLSFLLGMKVEEGVFTSGIPPMDLYQGKLSGALALDNKRWGIELKVEDMDLEKFNRVNAQLDGLKGLLTGKIAIIGNWGENSSIQGGGNFSLVNADLKNAPIFSAAQQGVDTMVKGFQMPDFKKVKGDFEIVNEIVTFKNTQATASGLDLRGSGTIDFSMQTNFTMGVKFTQNRDVRTSLFIFFPLETLGFDFLSKAIKVNIKGTAPDLVQTTSIQPLGWLTDTYNAKSSFDPNQYTLEKLWEKTQ